MRYPASSSILAALVLVAAPAHVFGCFQLSCRLTLACTDSLEAIQTEACDLFKNVYLNEDDGQKRKTSPFTLVDTDGCGYHAKKPKLLPADHALAVQNCAGKAKGKGIVKDEDFRVWRAHDQVQTQKLLEGLNWNLKDGGTIGDCKIVKKVACKKPQSDWYWNWP